MTVRLNVRDQLLRINFASPKDQTSDCKVEKSGHTTYILFHIKLINIKTIMTEPMHWLLMGVNSGETRNLNIYLNESFSHAMVI
jgi:hypothetical protein